MSAAISALSCVLLTGSAANVIVSSGSFTVLPDWVKSLFLISFFLALPGALFNFMRRIFGANEGEKNEN